MLSALAALSVGVCAALLLMVRTANKWPSGPADMWSLA
jgi:hypothetical protein